MFMSIYPSRMRICREGLTSLIASINQCEIKQTVSKLTKKASHCERVSWYEIPSDGICSDCSKDIFKLEKRYQIVEKYVSIPFGYYRH